MNRASASEEARMVRIEEEGADKVAAAAYDGGGDDEVTLRVCEV